MSDKITDETTDEEFIKQVRIAHAGIREFVEQILPATDKVVLFNALINLACRYAVQEGMQLKSLHELLDALFGSLTGNSLTSSSLTGGSTKRGIA